MAGDDVGNLPLFGAAVTDDRRLHARRLDFDDLPTPLAERDQNGAAGLGKREGRRRKTGGEWRLDYRDGGLGFGQQRAN